VTDRAYACAEGRLLACADLSEASGFCGSSVMRDCFVVDLTRPSWRLTQWITATFGLSFLPSTPGMFKSSNTRADIAATAAYAFVPSCSRWSNAPRSILRQRIRYRAAPL